MTKIIYIDGFVKCNPTKKEVYKILTSKGKDTDYKYYDTYIPAEILISDEYVLDFINNKMYYILDIVPIDNFINTILQ